MSTIKLDYFLDDPELKQRHELILPTYEMYRFFPPQDEILLKDSNPEKNYRFIFNGQPKTDFETEKLSKFHDYESKQGKLNYTQDWIESDTMRILQACEYNKEKTFKTIQENLEFLNSMPNTINDKIISLLNSGFLYVYGRDHHFRPIIVCSIKACTSLAEQKLYSFEDINNSIIYLLKYILKYLFIPGQIENWIIFVDFKDVGLSEIAEFKKILGTLNKYRGRVYRNFIVNISGFLKIAVKTALKVFGSSSSKKLKILGSDELHKIQEIISPDNIQQKYGGTAPNIVPGGNNLFPPIMPSKNFTLNGEKLNIISEEEYKEMCINSKPFKPFVIYPKLEESLKIQAEKDKEEESTKNSGILSSKANEKSKNETIKDIISIKEKKIGEKKEEKRDINPIKLVKINAFQKKNIVVPFLKEFENWNSIVNNEERSYSTKTPVNKEEINSFFNRIQNLKKNIIK